MKRRSFLKGLLAAPAVVAGCKTLPTEKLVPHVTTGLAQIETPVVDTIVTTSGGNTLMTIDEITTEALRVFHNNLHFQTMSK